MEAPEAADIMAGNEDPKSAEEGIGIGELALLGAFEELEGKFCIGIIASGDRLEPGTDVEMELLLALSAASFKSRSVTIGIASTGDRLLLLGTPLNPPIGEVGKDEEEGKLLLPGVKELELGRGGFNEPDCECEYGSPG